MSVRLAMVSLLKRLVRRTLGERLYIHVAVAVRRRLSHASFAAKGFRHGGHAPSAARQDLLPALRKKWLSREALPELAANSPLRTYLERSRR